MNEAETRAEHIDPALKDAGWGVVNGSRIRMEFPISKGRLVGNGQRSTPDKADYVLDDFIVFKQFRDVRKALRHGPLFCKQQAVGIPKRMNRVPRETSAFESDDVKAA